MLKKKPISKADKESMVAAALSDVDQRLRRCVQELWVLLPTNNRNREDFTHRFQMLSNRAIDNFLEDYEQFPRDANEQE